jgi:hypothetical protein
MKRWAIPAIAKTRARNTHLEHQREKIVQPHSDTALNKKSDVMVQAVKEMLIR